MTFSINDFRSQLVGGGARPSLFRVQMINPIDASGDLKLTFMCKAAQLPAMTTGSIEVPWMGRKTKWPGDRTYEDWTITVINDEDFLVRNAMETWQNALNTAEGNLRAPASRVKSTAEVVQYAQDGSILRVYTFDGIFPINVSGIDLSWETTDTIEEFQVTFQYDYFMVTGGKTGISTS